MANPKKILIVDDDPDFALANRTILQAAGYEVLTAEDGDTALELAREQQPDLVILDVMLGYDTEGFDIARQIHKLPELRATKVLLVTGIVKAKELHTKLQPDAEWLPVDQALDKPVDPPRLLAEVSRLLR